MSGLFSTLSTSNKGLQVSQTALQTVSHNVSNAGTKGYSMQRVQVVTSLPLSNGSGVGQIGTGAEVSSITRVRDTFLDYQIRKETSISSQYSARDEFLSQVDAIFNEPSSTGLSKDLSSFWNAWSQLASSPESTTARTLVVSNAKSLASTLNQIYSQLEELQDNAGLIIKEDDFSINGMLEQIKDLNAQIKAIYISGQTPNDLLDQRDLLIDELSKNIEITTSEGEFGGISISARVNNGAITLVDCDNEKYDSGLAYVGSLDYYIEDDSLSERISIEGTNSKGQIESIKYNNVAMDLKYDPSGSISGVQIDGTILSGNGDTVTFSDGKQMTVQSDNTLVVDGQTISVDSDTGKIKVDGNDVDINSSGQLIDTSSNKILFDGLSFKLASGNTFSSFSYGDEDVDLNNGILTVSSNGSSISFNGSKGTISVGGEDIAISALDSSNIKATATLYMEGNTNRVLRIENIDKDRWDDFSACNVIAFNYKEYSKFKNGKSSFDTTIDYDQASSFGFKNADFISGSIKGYRSIQDEIESYKEQLNNLAKVLAISVNEIHSGAGEGISFFTKEAETSSEAAKVISVNSILDEDPTKVNAGTVIGKTSGDGTRANLIARLKTTKIDILSIDSAESFINNTGLDLENFTIKGSSSGTTLDDYFNSLISELGVSYQEASKMVDNQESLLTQLETRKESISGVSLDEEMINMIQFQKAYVANAKVINAVQTLLDSVLSLV